MVAYIYGLYDPRVYPIVWRYVGKTVDIGSRARGHCIESSLREKTHKVAWVKSLLRDGVTPAIKVLEQVPDEGDWETAEREWIKLFREIGYPLTNTTDGGEGVCGTSPSPESNAKRSKSLKGKKKPPGFGAHLSKLLKGKPGHKQTAATRRKISVRNKGRKKTDQERRNQSIAARGHVVSEQQRRDISRTLTGRKHTVATKQKMSVSQTKRRGREQEIHALEEDEIRTRIARQVELAW